MGGPLGGGGGGLGGPAGTGAAGGFTVGLFSEAEGSGTSERGGGGAACCCWGGADSVWSSIVTSLDTAVGGLGVGILGVTRGELSDEDMIPVYL